MLCLTVQAVDEALDKGHLNANSVMMLAHCKATTCRHTFVKKHTGVIYATNAI